MAGRTVSRRGGGATGVGGGGDYFLKRSIFLYVANISDRLTGSRKDAESSMNNPILNEVLDLEMVFFKHQRARELPSVDCGQTVKLQLGTLVAAEAMKGLELYRRVTDAIKMKIKKAEMGYCY